MFVRLFFGIILYLGGDLYLLLTDLVGHIKKPLNSGTATLCIFGGNLHSTSYPHIEMHWSAMAAASILLGVGPLVVMTNALESISAQSPH